MEQTAANRRESEVRSSLGREDIRGSILASVNLLLPLLADDVF